MGVGGAASEGGQRTALILGKGANANWPSWGPSAGRGVRRPGLGVPPALGLPRGKGGADVALPPIRPGTGIWGGFPVSPPLRPSLPGPGGPPASGAGPVRHSGDFHQHHDSSLRAAQGGMGRPCPWPTQSCPLSWVGSGLSRAPALLWALPGPGGGDSVWIVLGPLGPVPTQRRHPWDDEWPWKSLSARSQLTGRKNGPPKASPTAASMRPGAVAGRGEPGGGA